MGKISKCSFKSPCGKLVGVVHGDDILLAGPTSLVDAARKSLRKRCETREQMMGLGPTDGSEIVMLNRRVQWTKEGIRISPDPRHVKEIIEELGAKPADTPMIVSQYPEPAVCHTVPEAPGQVVLLGNGSPDIRYAASIMGSHASSPKDAYMVMVKRVERFLIKRPITWTHYRWGVRSYHIMTYTDSDWAANREDRRSGGGGMLLHNGGTLEILVKKAEGGVAFVVGK